MKRWRSSWRICWKRQGLRPWWWKARASVPQNGWNMQVRDLIIKWIAQIWLVYGNDGGSEIRLTTTWNIFRYTHIHVYVYMYICILPAHGGKNLYLLAAWCRISEPSAGCHDRMAVFGMVLIGVVRGLRLSRTAGGIAVVCSVGNTWKICHGQKYRIHLNQANHGKPWRI